MSRLFVVATPIGNLSDASPRMVDTLRSAGLIAAEDTRVTGNLLRHFGISTPLTSLHRHNESSKAGRIVERMLSEELDVALVTDAGTPAISDPGHLLVRAANEAGIEVLAIAGPTAMAAAISVSGFDAREFAFYGFLPRERGDLRKRLKDIARGPRVAVLHESPHRIMDLMDVAADTLPGCRACVCCDLTKLHEKTLRGDAAEVLEALRANPKAAKGEYCVVLDLHEVTMPEEAVEAPELSLEARLLDRLLRGETMQDAVDALTAGGGVRRNDAKRAAIALRRFLETGEV
ncbi:16S rRNA (cytidine(1402)-2'-O)-methyltransferase [Eubacteriales bacterium OttesenSCG-928-A19]|nr:16S rRNA (cytidine(1402)-2'-O)-methyltransferase [Eubacteriales bacterium OttesenSCG-928-A19]